MTKNLLLIFGLSASVASAQSFTAANEYANGAAQKMYLIDSAATAYPSIVGTDVTWDYSIYNKTANGTRIDTIYANTNTNFPSANKVNSIQGVITTYMENDANGRSIRGFDYVTGNVFLGTINVKFDTDRLDFMTYPFAMNATLNDVFSGTVTSSLGINAASGVSYSKVDGIGTLKLSPTVTKTNVIRHHLLDTINTTVTFGSTFPVMIILNQYDYYDFSGNNLPLLTYVKVKIFQNGTVVSNLNFVLNSVEPQLGVGLDEESNNAFTIYPNPVSSKLNLEGKFSGNEQISILDLNGKTVFEGSFSPSISTENLENGIYILQIENAGIVSSQRFIKE